MVKAADSVSDSILNLIRKASEPLETKEIENILKNVTRTKILYRLNNLRGEGKIRGKPVGSGKGTWIWWAENKMKVVKN